MEEKVSHLKSLIDLQRNFHSLSFTRQETHTEKYEAESFCSENCNKKEAISMKILM